MKKNRRKRLTGIEGADFVRCRICGDHRRAISTRHLSKHETDRETYMEEYALGPDELIAKDFRRQQSSRPDFKPCSKREWLDAIKAAYKRNPRFLFYGNVEIRYPQLYSQGVWLFGTWEEALRGAGFDPEGIRPRKSWDREAVVKRIPALRRQNVPLSANYAMKNLQGD